MVVGEKSKVLLDVEVVLGVVSHGSAEDTSGGQVSDQTNFSIILVGLTAILVDDSTEFWFSSEEEEVLDFSTTLVDDSTVFWLSSREEDVLDFLNTLVDDSTEFRFNPREEDLLDSIVDSDLFENC